MSILFRHIIRSLAAPALATLALAALPSCSAILDTPDGICPEEEAADKETGTVVLTLTVGLDDTGDLSRANNYDPYTGPYDDQDTYTAGTNYERTVNTINIFLFDVDDDGNPKISTTENNVTTYHCQNINLGAGYEGMEHDRLTYATLPWTSSEQNKWFYARATFDHTTTGTKLIYVAANLSDAMIQSVIQNGPGAEYTISNFDLNAGRAIAGRYFANSEDEDRALTSLDSDGQRGMSFFCTKVGEIKITSLNQEEVYVGPTFHLRRLAAKVHVTCETYPGLDYVITKRDGNGNPDDSDVDFWCKQEDVSYTVNTVNLHTHLMQQIPDGTAADPYPNYAIDPNWNTACSADTWNTVFAYHPTYSWANYSDFFAATEKYDEGRVPGNTISGQAASSEVYTKGIYVPENSFEANNTAFADDNAEYNISHLIIRAKIYPRKIWLPVGISSVVTNQDLKDKLIEAEGSTDPEKVVTITKSDNTSVTDANGNTLRIFLYTCENISQSQEVRKYDLIYSNYGSLTIDGFYADEIRKDVDGEDVRRQFYSYGAAYALSQSYHKSDNVDDDDTMDFYYWNKNDGPSPDPDTYTPRTLEVFAQGMSTYRCYLSNTWENPNYEKDIWDDSNVYRNIYYLVHVSMIKSPGNGLDPNDSYVELYTQKIPYINSWRAEVEITD